MLESWIDWFGPFVPPRRLVTDEATYVRLRNDYWPRFRFEVAAEGEENALERIAVGKGGAEVRLRTLDAAWNAPLLREDHDLFHLLGYADVMASARTGEPVTLSDLRPRLDLHIPRMILQLIRLAFIARRDEDETKRADARERLRQASRDLGMGWDGTPAEAEVHKANLVDELRELLKRARRTYRSRLVETGSGNASITAARKQWEPHMRVVFHIWEASGGSPDREALKTEQQWGKILSHEPQEGEPYLRNLARSLLGSP
jgi:hypothetical protein